MVGYPYTKYMVSVMDVDMAAALILSTHARADELGVPADRRVYLRGWCYAEDPVYVAEHEPMWCSPAMATAARTALEMARRGIDDIAHLDLYSCFASSVNFALDALGVAAGDSRGVTVTGGLPYFGGAASDYMTHSIATMVDVLRHDPGAFGLVSGVGMHMTKHVYGVYSTTPGARTPVDAPKVETGPRPITDSYAGTAVVATYSVAHGRDGAPAWGLLVCDLPDGSRCYARSDEPAVLDAMERDEWVGARVDLATDGVVNRLA
jgi:acetyl-CoA C-acetyltransferase